MQIFLTGATGYVGGAIAKALLAQGHKVTALIRNPDKARRFEEQGGQVLTGDLTEADKLTEAARAAEAVIHAGNTNDANAPAVDRAAVMALIAGLADSDKPFIYTSGIWVLGDTGGKVVDETSPLNPTPLVAWRPAVEQLALSAKHGMVIRPGLVYGRNGSLPAMLWGQARQQGVARYIGEGNNHWPLVYIDDVADLYVRTLQAPAGTVLFAVNEEVITFHQAAEAAARGAGIEGKVASWPLEEARQVFGPMADALALDQRITAARARQLLGWSHKGPTLKEELSQGSYALAAAQK